MDQIVKYLQKNFAENELTKVRQTVIPEVYLMLESFMESSRLFTSEKNCEVFFSVFFKLIFFPAINFTDKFKIFLEERYITVVMKRLPEALSKNSSIFRDHFLKFATKIMDSQLDNSMVNVIICNILQKLVDTFHGCKSAAAVFTKNSIVAVCRSLVKLIEKVRDGSYMAMVKSSKNYKEMVWYSASSCYQALVESLFTDGNLDSSEAIKLLQEFSTLAKQTRNEVLPTIDKIKVDSLRELTLYILQQPKILQNMIIFSSQLEDKPEENMLLEVMDEVKTFETFLSADPFNYYSDDLECKNLVSRYIKNLLETNNRILAAVCSDHKKSAEAYKELVMKYSKTFDDYLKIPRRGQTSMHE